MLYANPGRKTTLLAPIHKNQYRRSDHASIDGHFSEKLTINSLPLYLAIEPYLSRQNEHHDEKSAMEGLNCIRM
jgi:hypothetical protein